MANRYWVLGTGTWNGTNMANWSDSSGGSGGFSVPTNADEVYIDLNSVVGTTIISLGTGGGLCKNIRFTSSAGNYTGTFAMGSLSLTISGTVCLFVSSMTLTYTANSAGVVYFNGPSGTNAYLTTAGLTLPALTINASANLKLYLSDNLKIQASSAGLLNIAWCKFDSQGYSIECGRISISSICTSCNFGASNITIKTASSTSWSNAYASVNMGTSTLNIPGGGTFVGGGANYNIVSFSSGGVSTITGSNTISSLVLQAGSSVKFTAGTSQALTSLTATGTSSSGITIQSTTAGSIFTITDTAGTNTVSYVTIKDSTVSGGAVFDASNGTNTDSGNNSGWLFLTSNINNPICY